MKKVFLIVALVLFLLINVDTVHGVGAYLWGYLGFSQALNTAVPNSDYLFFSAFRVLPFLILGFIVLKLGLLSSRTGKFVAWFALGTIALFILYGYWSTTYLMFYSSTRGGSTVVLEFMFIPIVAIFIGCLGAGVGYAIGKGTQKSSKSSS